MAQSTPALVVVHEHPDWQKPLFAALRRRAIVFDTVNVVSGAFDNIGRPRSRLYFNQASPSAYVRGNTRAVPLALAYMRTLERFGARVLNGSEVFALELSKSAQAALLTSLGIDTPLTITFNDPRALGACADAMTWPALIKPDQGGSGARIQVVESLAHIDAIFAANPALWQPDNLFVLQPLVPHDYDRGIVRLEFLGGRLLYAMRVVTHGRFNLCPSPVCNPEDGENGACELPQAAAVPPPEFVAYPDVPDEAVATALRIVNAAKLDVGGIEYLETAGGRRVFYDINANSNLRPSIAATFGFDPFERVVDYLEQQIAEIEQS